MHEASLMRDLMRRIEAIADREAATRVTRVEVWLGALSHMTDAHFRDHFAQAAAGTRAESADLFVELSEDIHHPDAQAVVLKGVEVEGE